MNRSPLLLSLLLLFATSSSVAEITIYQPASNAEIEAAHSSVSEILFEFDNLDSTQYVFQITDEAIVQITLDKTVSAAAFTRITQRLMESQKIKGLRSRHGNENCFF